MRVTQSLAKLSSYLSLCLLLVWRSKRDDRAQGEEALRRTGRRGGASKGEEQQHRLEEHRKEHMEGLIGSLPIVLQGQEYERMDGRVWGNLPDELQDKVLACLPVPVLLRFRSVCERWRSLLSSEPFLKPRAGALCSRPHFLVYDTQKAESWGVFDPTLEKWYTIPDRHRPLGRSAISMAFDGGLICAVVRPSWHLGCTQLVVFNPVTSFVRELPVSWVSSRKKQTIPSGVVIVVDRAKNSFKVLAAGYNGCAHTPTCLCRVTEVYDSVSNRWETTGDLPWKGMEFLGGPLSFAVCGGIIYCLATDSLDAEAQKLVAYDLEKKEWTVIPVELPSLCGPEVLLYESQGVLVLVHRHRSPNGVPEIFTWQPGLQPASRKWTQVKILLPRDESFTSLFWYDKVSWGGHGNLIFFVSHKWDRALLYDITRKVWSFTPVSQFLRVSHAPNSKLVAVPFDFSLRLISK